MSTKMPQSFIYSCITAPCQHVFTRDVRPLQQIRGQLDPAIVVPSCLARGCVVYLSLRIVAFVCVARVSQPLCFHSRGWVVVAAAIYRRFSGAHHEEVVLLAVTNTTSGWQYAQIWAAVRREACLVMGRLTVTIELALLDIPSHTTISFVAIPKHRARSQKWSMRLCMLTSVSIFFEGIGSGCGSVGFAVAGLAVQVSSNICL